MLLKDNLIILQSILTIVLLALVVSCGSHSSSKDEETVECPECDGDYDSYFIVRCPDCYGEEKLIAQSVTALVGNIATGAMGHGMKTAPHVMALELIFEFYYRQDSH